MDNIKELIYKCYDSLLNAELSSTLYNFIHTKVLYIYKCKFCNKVIVKDFELDHTKVHNCSDSYKGLYELIGTYKLDDLGSKYEELRHIIGEFLYDHP